MWPGKDSVTLKRIWCLYEIWTCVSLEGAVNVVFVVVEAALDFQSRISVSMPYDDWMEFKEVFKLGQWDSDTIPKDERL